MASEIPEVGPVAAAAILIELMKTLRASGALSDAEIGSIRTRAAAHSEGETKQQEIASAIDSLIAEALS
ncbi:hypothetical protein [Methylobacterium sp. ARG-1]|uniref:hypothetical protein n=1 Tax=Methylobacterium sp. ARG-1 TaxID=1692501 RepID=UPI000A3EEADD|nr:hypothetical protein [Methylobacterium sp. ARG-1]